MDKVEASGLLCVACDDLAWRPSTFAPGLSVKDVGTADGMEMQVLRFEPGTHLPLHTHECPEFIYVLDGELIVAGQRLTAGSASIAGVGSVHADVHSEKGCMIVLVDRPL